MKKLTALIALMIITSLAARAVEPDTLRISFIGDVMCHSRQLRLARVPEAGGTGDAAYDFSPYFRYVKPVLDTCNISVANMEFPVGAEPFSGYPVFSAPESLAREAANAGIDLFLAANNHIIDKGKRGLDSTFAAYGRLPVRFTGIWRDTIEERVTNPAIIDANGFRVAFINFTYGLNGFSVPSPYVVGQLDSLYIKTAIQRARNRGADYIVAVPHWGVEYNLDYHPEQRRWKERLYRWGVDMIVGTHPHVPQAVEFTDGHITAYSLGNFVSNMNVVNSQIGILLVATLVRRENGSIETLPPRVIWLWCGNEGLLEDNYTVIPIESFLHDPEAFNDRAQYDKMVREYLKIKQKFPQY